MLAVVLELEALHHLKQARHKLAVHYRELAVDRRAVRARMAPWHEVMETRRDMLRVMERRKHEVMSEIGLRSIRNAIAPSISRRTTAHD
jgi:hypothetical protein